MPFHSTMLDELNHAPFMSSVNPPLPARTPSGKRETIRGDLFDVSIIERGKAEDMPPPGAGVPTLIVAVPTSATSDGLI